jgi:hypothetical protein
VWGSAWKLFFVFRWWQRATLWITLGIIQLIERNGQECEALLSIHMTEVNLSSSVTTHTGKEIERDAHLILHQILISSSLSFPLISFPCFCFFDCQILWNFSGDTVAFPPLTQDCLCSPSHLCFFF